MHERSFSGKHRGHVSPDRRYVQRLPAALPPPHNCRYRKNSRIFFRTFHCFFCSAPDYPPVKVLYPHFPHFHTSSHCPVHPYPHRSADAYNLPPDPMAQRIRHHVHRKQNRSDSPDQPPGHSPYSIRSHPDFCTAHNLSDYRKVYPFHVYMRSLLSDNPASVKRLLCLSELPPHHPSPVIRMFPASSVHRSLHGRSSPPVLPVGIHNTAPEGYSLPSAVPDVLHGMSPDGNHLPLYVWHVPFRSGV